MGRLSTGNVLDWNPTVVSAFFMDGGFYLLLFTLTHVLAAAGASSAEIALVFGLYTLVYAVMTPILGRTSDRRGRRRCIVGGAAVFLLTSLSLTLAIDLSWVGGRLCPQTRFAFSLRGCAYVGIAAYAVTNALFWPALQARMGDVGRDPRRVAGAVRSFNVAWTAGKATGFLGAGFMFRYSPQACLPAASFVAVLVFLSVLPRPTPQLRQSISPQRRVEWGHEIPRATKRAYLLASLLTNFGVWGALSTLKSLAPKMSQAMRLSADEMGIVLGSALLAQGVGFLYLQADRWAYRPGPLLTTVPLALAGLLVLWWAQSMSVALIGAVALGLAQALAYSASVYTSLDYDDRRGLRTGIHEAVIGVGGAIPILGGVSADLTGELRMPLLCVSGLLVAGLPLLVCLVRQPGKRANPDSQPRG